MQRRSTTRSTPRKRYTVDAFEGVEELQDARSDSEDGIEERDVRDDSAEEFDAAADQSSQEDGDDDAMSGLEAEPEAGDLDGDEHAGEADLDDSMSIADEDIGTSEIYGLKSTPKRARMLVAPHIDSTGARTYARGIIETQARSMSREVRISHLYGSDEHDHKRAEDTMVKWAFDPTLPSRVSDSKGFGGMHRSFFLDEEVRAQEATKWQHWWKDAGGEIVFAERQILDSLNEEAAGGYLGGKHSKQMPFLMGHFRSQRVFELGIGQSVDLQEDLLPAAGTDGAFQPQAHGRRTGYILNVGGKVRSLDWASSCAGQDQFLALSTMTSSQYPIAQSQNSKGPAFNPQLPHKSTVQIWKFQSTHDGRLTPGVEPQLHTLLCTEWGDARVLKWCPSFHDEADADHPALLAGIWIDGTVRVLNVPLESNTTETKFLRATSAAFESRPPNTICTCLTWISRTRLAAGCANGCIAVWDLPAVTSRTPINVRPTIYSAAASSYIISIASCSPSRPNLILTSTMSCFLTLSDLSHATQSLTSEMNTANGKRNRMGLPFVIWHDFAQTALSVDDNYHLRGTALRRLFTSTALARYKSAATCLASSPCHPFVLVGMANGDVISSNPTKRIVDGKAGIWQQTWFNHEWRRPTPAEEAATAARATTNGYETDEEHEVSSAAARIMSSNTNSETSHFRISQQGLSRFLDGFKAERCQFSVNDRNPHTVKDGVSFTTIHEEKTAITALAWNPNLHVGGWAAAGMGSGLVRIEDLALDTN